MPFTPLHFALGAPLHRKASWPGFVLANIVTDIPVALGMGVIPGLPPILSGEPGASLHDTLTHTLAGALALALLLWPIGRTRKWLYGVTAGTLTHLVLDALYHPDIHVLGRWGGTGLLGLRPPQWALDGPLLIGLILALIWAMSHPQSIRNWR